MLMAALVSLLVLATVINFYSATTMTYVWYPIECRHGQGCAPVESMTCWASTSAAAAAGFAIEARHDDYSGRLPGTPVKRRSAHVCMCRNEFGSWEVMCLLLPPPT